MLLLQESGSEPKKEEMFYVNGEVRIAAGLRIR